MNSMKLKKLIPFLSLIKNNENFTRFINNLLYPKKDRLFRQYLRSNQQEPF